VDAPVNDVVLPATALRSKDLLGIAELTPEEILLILDTTEAMKEISQRQIKKVPALRGRTVVNLFFEASTRTRTSFEIAEKRLSADTLAVAIANSSVIKGETLVDTAKNIEAMGPSMIVLRHPASGAPHLLSRLCKSPIINAGDGLHEHPTQALLDAFTIRERKGRIAGLKVAIVGDLLHSRVLRSNVLLLTKLGADVWVCGPRTLIPMGLDQLGVHTSNAWRAGSSRRCASTSASSA
jgi:aspartate carbamoyltransferase catalytic subunit